MDVRLDEARAACDAGRVETAIALVSLVVAEADVESEVVEAATLVPLPVDPLMRARVHLLTAEAATRVSSPALVERLSARSAETVDHFRPEAPLTAEAMDELARTGQRSALLDAIAAFATEATTALDRSRLHLLLGAQALMDGRFDSASAHVDTARSLGGPGSDAFYLDPVFGSARARLTGHDADQMVGTVRRLVEELPAAARGWLALALMTLDERAEVLRLWELLAPHADAVPPEAPEFLIATTGSAEICAWVGDRRTAERLHARLEPYSGRHAVAHATSPYEGPVDLALGRLERVLGRQAQARDRLRDAVAACRVVHAPAHEALALAELARVEGAGTRARAEAVAAARAIAEELGMEPLLVQVRGLGPGTASGPLTPRESEIVDILTTGATNAEIAARLYLSERTVENHLSRAMLKIGVSSRTALALWRAREVDAPSS